MLFSPQTLVRSRVFVGGGGGGGGGAGATATAFLARTSGLDGTHISAYTALLNGLDADSLTTKLDMLHVYATQDSTTAGLNLISSSYPATLVSAPTFSADNGYTSTAGGIGYIRTGFTPSTATSPKFVQNSAHISIWLLNNHTSAGTMVMGGNGAGGAGQAGMHARFSDGSSHYVVNNPTDMAVSNASTVGHFLANRADSTNVQGYKNGSSVVTNGAISSQSVTAAEILVLGQNNNGSLNGVGNDYQAAMASIGASLSSTDVTNFYNRLRTYMTAVGVP